MAPSSLTSSKKTDSAKKAGTSASSSKATLKSTAATGVASESAGTTGSGTATAKSKTAEDVGKVVIPSVLSSLAALAGIFYKLKSRIIK